MPAQSHFEIVENGLKDYFALHHVERHENIFIISSLVNGNVIAKFDSKNCKDNSITGRYTIADEAVTVDLSPNKFRLDLSEFDLDNESSDELFEFAKSIHALAI